MVTQLSLQFSDDYLTFGSFEKDVLTLLEKARTTETIHYRVIVDLKNPFTAAVDVTVVKNQLGARVAFEGIKDANEAAGVFQAHFAYGSFGKTDSIRAFYTLSMLEKKPKNTDHPGIYWCIDPSLLEQACYKQGRYSFFLVPIEKCGFIRDETALCPGINLSLEENSMLTDIPSLLGMQDEIQSFRKVYQSGEITSGPSICLIVFDNGSMFQDVFVHANGIPGIGYFPVLYGLKISQGDDEHNYYCTPGNNEWNNPRGILIAKRLIKTMHAQFMSTSEQSIMDWEGLVTAMRMYQSGYDDGHDAATRSHMADELAGD